MIELVSPRGLLLLCISVVWNSSPGFYTVLVSTCMGHGEPVTEEKTGKKW